MPKQPFTSKVCPVCRIDKPRSDYYKKSTWVSHKCKVCTLADNAARFPRYRDNEKYDARRDEWRRNRYRSDPVYRARIAAQKKARYDARNTELNTARRERWATDPNNPARFTQRYRHVVLRTPKWVSRKELAAIYAACPDGMEVDHVVPLKGLIDGRPVSGLHVPWNLQYLPVAQNRKKKHRISERDVALVC